MNELDAINSGSGQDFVLKCSVVKLSYCRDNRRMILTYENCVSP
jgi:hypothetical protein